MQEDLAVGIGKSAVDGIATHDRNDVRILLGLVFPENLAIIIQVERKHWVWERPMHIHDVADDEWSPFMAAQNASRKRPCHLQLANILGGDLFELGVTLVGIVSCPHHPIFWVLRHSDQLTVGVSRGARTKDRYDAHACGEQEIAHRYPPCDSTAGDDGIHCAASRHPFHGRASGSVSQRNGAHFALTPGYEDTSGFP